MSALALLLLALSGPAPGGRVEGLQAPPEGGAPASPAKPAAQEAKPAATPAQEKPPGTPGAAEGKQAPPKPLWQDF